MNRKTGLILCLLLLVSAAAPAAVSAAVNPSAAAGWVRQTSGVTSNLTSISALDDQTAWAVGSNGVVLKTVNGTAWNPQYPGHPTTTLNCVKAVDSNTAWAVGNQSVAIVTVDGTNWNTTPSAPLPYTKNFQGVWASDALHAWAVGYDGSVVKTADGGANWTKQTVPTTEDLWSIDAVSDATAWAVGNDGTILKTTNGGAKWVKQQSGTDQMLRSVHAVDAQNALVVGYGGVIRRTSDGGATWNREACPVDDILFSASVVDPEVAWGVGYNDGTDVGFAFKTTDSGRNWFMQPIKDAAELRSISVLDADTAWAVGDSGHIWKTDGGGETLYTWYFAEGYTGPGFQEYLCMGNAGAAEATAYVDYISQGGSTINKTYKVPANSRVTIDVNGEIGIDKQASIKVSSYSPDLVAERPMYFNYTGNVGKNWTGGTDAIGARSPSFTWFFAEGNTLPEFDQYITVLNPLDSTKDLTFRYQIEGEGEKVVEAEIGGSSRSTFKARDHVGDGKNISLLLECTGPVVAERPMYFDYMGLAARRWTGGHCVLGTPYPGKDWFLAEGTTRDNVVDGAFEQWLTIQNPTGAAATIDATYQLGPGQGNPVEKTYTVPANERLTVSVNGEIGANKDVSVHLTSESDFIVERPMYFNYHLKYAGGHDVMGTGAAANEWFLAEGYTGAGFEQWLCVQNAGAKAAVLQITYYPQGGAAPIKKTHTVPAGTRYTIDVNNDAGQNLMISARIIADNPVIVERPMYFLYGGAWPGGTDVVGFSPGN